MHFKILKKCNKLWKAAAMPKSAEAIEKILGHTLSRPGATRWNSLYDSLKQILSIKDKTSELMRALTYKEILNENEFLYISEFLDCCQPFAQAIDIVQGEESVYYGTLLPCLLALRRKLQLLDKKEWVFCKVIVKSLLESLFSSFLLKKAVTAALSYPKFKRKWLLCVNPNHHLEILSQLTKAVIEEMSAEEKDSSEEVISGQSEKNDDFF